MLNSKLPSKRNGGPHRRRARAVLRLAPLATLTAVALACACSQSGGGAGESAGQTAISGGGLETARLAASQMTLQLRPNVSKPSALGQGGLGELMRRTHFAYRAVEGADHQWQASHQTYSVRVRSEGRPVVEATPVGAATHETSRPGRRAEAVRGAPITLETQGLQRTDANVLGPAGAVPRVASDGTLEVAYGEVVERWRNDEDGIEQSFEIAREPLGAGDLLVRVKAGGQAFVAATDSGLHFEDAATGLGFRYGLATWIDATGASATVTPSYADGDIVLQVPASVVDGSVYPVVLDPVVGPELGLDNPILSIGDVAQTWPAVAYDPSTKKYLVAWGDNRNTFRSEDLYGIFVTDLNSRTLSPGAAFPIASATGGQDAPAVAYASTAKTFLVAWSDFRSGINNDIYAARIDPSTETVLDLSSILVSNHATADEIEVSVASSGSEFFVVWSDQRNGTYDLFGRRVSSAGTLVDANDLALKTGTGDQRSPDVVWNSTLVKPGYLVAYQDSFRGTLDIEAVWARFTPNLSLGPTITVCTAANDQLHPAVATLGTTGEDLIVWEDHRNEASSALGDIYGARVDMAGYIANSERAFAVQAGAQTEPDTAQLATTTYAVIWQDARSGTPQIYMNRLNNGIVMSGSGLAVTSGTASRIYPAIACDTQLWCLGAWQDTVSGDLDVFGSLIMSTGGDVVFPIGKAGNSETDTAVAFDGTNYLVVWADRRNVLTTGSDLYGVRVSQKGTILDGTAIPIAVEAGNAATPAAAFDGSNYLVVWADDRNAATSAADVYGARVTPAGTVLDPHALVISNADGDQTDPQVAFGASNYFVTWTDYRGSRSAVYGSRVTPGGTVVDGSLTGLQLSSSTSSQTSPSVAFTNNEFLTVWQGVRSGLTHIMGTRIAEPAGTVMDQPPKTVCCSTGTQWRPSAAASDREFLVAWEENSTDIYGARVTPAFSVLDPSGRVLSSAAGDQTMPKASFDGFSYFVTWQDNRTKANGLDVYGSWFSTALTNLTPSGVAVVSTVGVDDSRPSVAFSDTGLGLLAYHRFTAGDTDLNTFRAYARTVQRANVLGATCTDGTDCVSDRCADGLCCNVACSNACDVCAASLGASRDGFCGYAPSTSGGEPPCAGYLCSGSAATCPTECKTDGDCQAAYYCAADATCKPRKSQSAACSQATDCRASPCRVCASAGGCVDGFCCNTTCSGACDVCAASLGASVNGTCATAPISYPGSPACAPFVCNGSSTSCPSTCASDAECAPDRYCDGTSHCSTRKAQGVQCNDGAGGDCLQSGCRVCSSAGGCVDGFCCNSACGEQCDACAASMTGGTSGTCMPKKPGQPGTPACSGGLLCNGTLSVCPTSCNADADCASTALFCGPIDHLCHTRKDIGEDCSGTEKCLQNLYCVDGVCCTTQCTSPCHSCNGAQNVSGTSGSCEFTKTDLDPRNDCSQGDPAACGLTGDCNGGGACKYYDSSLACQTPQCDGNTSKEKHCSGGGQCIVDLTGDDCGLYKCKGGIPCPTSCAVDADCVASAYCHSSGVCIAKGGIGVPCTAGNQCALGYCVDGVCCDTACSGLCQACKASLKQVAVDDGVCGASQDGTDPHNECQKDAQSTCLQSGECDGAGACAKYASGTSCGPNVCQGNESKPQVCNGSGTCEVATTGNDCGAYACTNGQCVGGVCQSDTDCVQGSYCDSPPDGTCMSKKATGLGCAAANQCESGFCVDQVCCNQACGGLCMACSGAAKGGGVDGDCGFVAAGSDPDADCQESPQASCKGDGFCDGQGACRQWAAGLLCGNVACSGSNVVTQICDGLGSCVNGVPSDCSPYQCAAGVCTSPCTSDLNCVQGYFCSTTQQCVPKKAVGTACSTTAECLSGYCVDGFCCDTACTNACFACAAALKANGNDDGVCGAAVAGQDPHDDCDKDPANSCDFDGECDGTGACRLYQSDAVCGSPVCSTTNPNQLLPMICDGFGQCKTSPLGSSCGAYLCIADSCPTACASDDQCVTGFRCDGSQCVAKLDDGSPCAQDASCSGGHCVDGICCDTACTGICEACDATGKEGTCSPVTGAPHGTRPACAGADACAGTCNGTETSACTFPGSSASCVGSCPGGGDAQGTCDGQGHCTVTGCEQDGGTGGSSGGAGGSGAGGSGTSGSGGTGATGPTDAGTSGAPASPEAASDGGGCGCRTASDPTSTAATWGLFGLLAAGALSRRRRSTTAARRS